MSAKADAQQNEMPLFGGLLVSQAREGTAFLAGFKKKISSVHEEIILGTEKIPNVKQYDDSLAEAEKKVDDFDFMEAALKLLIERKKRVQTKHDLMVQAAKAALEQFRATSNGVVRLVMDTVRLVCR